ncbi:hypothetical protein [Streptomyces sp. NPDC049879]|uniref:hypothetical protein n=1 Tax=Streptomyces sp. NPDC049879 TaxID=3365598 RepID=UPI0037AB0FA9
MESTARLVGYVTELLPPTDTRYARPLSVRALARVRRDDESSTDADSGLPRGLATAVRGVVREWLHPTRRVHDQVVAAVLHREEYDRGTAFWTGAAVLLPETERLVVTHRGHWFRTDDGRDWLDNRVCRGCTATGGRDYILDACGPCSRPPTADDIRAAFDLPDHTPVEMTDLPRPAPSAVPELVA